ncbi:MAG: hypothetical protein JXB03_04395 [Spirochaetales bacterium]|nr:hypothetical protein [Spirochaetales bacterium]
MGNLPFIRKLMWGLCAAFITLGNAAAGDIELSGMLRSYGGARLQEYDIPVTEQTVDISLKGWGTATQIYVNPYAYLDSNGVPELGIREAYIDLYLPFADLRIGKQAIVWGTAEGVFITDIVSPQDMRSFILADFREIRMGIPALKADYYAGDFTIEAVWVPRFVPSALPDPGSIWYKPEMNMLSTAAAPSDGLSNSEIFGNISYFGSGLNAEIMAGYAWDDYPVQVSPGTFAYRRYTVAGGSLSTTLASVVIRTEAAVYLNRGFTYTPPRPMDEHHQLQGLAGIDWNLWGIDMSAQYIAGYIFDHNDSMVEKELTHTGTFRVRDSFLSETLHVEMFVYLGADPWDALLRPSITYAVEDSVELEVGAEVFIGDEAGKFGRYSSNSLGFASLRWYF